MSHCHGPQNTYTHTSVLLKKQSVLQSHNIKANYLWFTTGVFISGMKEATERFEHRERD
jgi:hypothetical protein